MCQPEIKDVDQYSREKQLQTGVRKDFDFIDWLIQKSMYGSTAQIGILLIITIYELVF